MCHKNINVLSFPLLCPNFYITSTMITRVPTRSATTTIGNKYEVVDLLTQYVPLSTATFS